MKLNRGLLTPQCSGKQSTSFMTLPPSYRHIFSRVVRVSFVNRNIRHHQVPSPGVLSCLCINLLK